MTIDLTQWTAELSEYFAKSINASVSDRPADYFDGFFCEIGYPADDRYFPIWAEDGIVVYCEGSPYEELTSNVLKYPSRRDDPRDQEYEVYFISDEGVLGNVSPENGSLSRCFTVRSPTEAAFFIRMFWILRYERRSSSTDR